MRETELYGPVKKLLETQGYEVKGEIGAVDLVAVRGDEAPVIVELKSGFSLSLIHQGIARLRLSDTVYVAVPEWKGRAGWKAFRRNLELCRRLGLGVITISGDTATVQTDPGPYAPRKSMPRKERLLGEFQNRVGDPNTGGSTRVRLITAYRQDALRCLLVLAENGATKASDVARQSCVVRARSIMSADHYGWFERVGHGVYQITPKGYSAMKVYAVEIEELK